MVSERKTKVSIRAKLLSMLAKREYSRVEIEQKVSAWLKKKSSLSGDAFEEVSNEQAQELINILDEFETRGWLSDERFAESLVNQKAQRLGVRRLEQEFKRKGIDEQLTQEVLEELKETEFDRAREVWERKFKCAPATPKEYQKQIRFMVYRGFSTGVVKKILNMKSKEGMGNESREGEKSIEYE